ncbi:MAG: DUF3179 domain-containing (seleno)protein [Halobacteriales archaeon]|nr:DUF3179 domain-containing (seleno)protein [Halobacteriales archaeon]
MDRRAYLATLASGAGALAAGCVGARVAESSDPTPTAARTPRRRLADVELPVPETELTQAIHSIIPAIVEPAFARDWSGLEIGSGSRTYKPRLRAETPVVGVERHGVARAYPLGVLERHEVVNDVFPAPPGAEADREPLLVTYCPSCGSSMTALRRIGNTVPIFEVSHFLWKSNLVLRDSATRSLWSQLLAGAIRGPATGTQLTLVPSTLEPWGSWRASHPDTRVLLPPPHSKSLYEIGGKDYEYARFTDTAPLIGEDADGFGAGRTLVIGVARGGEAVAYPFEAVVEAGVVNDIVGGTPVVVAVGPGGTLVAYERRTEGSTLRFRRGDGKTLLAGGSRWLVERGVALDGPFEGVGLRRANDVPPLFRFAWEDFHPGTRIFGDGG